MGVRSAVGGARLVQELRDKRWTEEDAKQVLAVWRESGLSARGFAREHGLDDQRLNWWRKRLGNWKPKPDARRNDVVRFVPAVIREGAIGAPIVVRLPNGLAIEVDSRVVSAEWLASLLAEVSG